MTFNQLLKEAEKKINSKGLEETVAKILLTYVSNFSLQELYCNIDQEVDIKIIKEFNKALDLYLIDEVPVQYITGIQPFYGYDFIVNEDVLIPRYETEELVEYVIYYIEQHFSDKNISILDIGTGSGCIGITLKKELENVDVTLTDISQKALNVAKENSVKLDADVKLIESNLYNSIGNLKFDCIISNPPYIPNDEGIGPTVKHEPKISLYGGLEGLDFYEKIIVDAPKYLKEFGLIAFEHAYNKAKEIKEMILNTFPKANVFQHQDLSGKDRITVAVIGDENDL